MNIFELGGFVLYAVLTVLLGKWLAGTFSLDLWLAFVLAFVILTATGAMIGTLVLYTAKGRQKRPPASL